MNEITPTPEQEQRAKWDLLLLDIEHRTEQLRQLKDPMRLLELELRAEQVRQLKRYELWKVVATLATASVVVGSGIAAGIFGLIHLLHP